MWEGDSLAAAATSVINFLDLCFQPISFFALVLSTQHTGSQILFPHQTWRIFADTPSVALDSDLLPSMDFPSPSLPTFRRTVDFFSGTSSCKASVHKWIETTESQVSDQLKEELAAVVGTISSWNGQPHWAFSSWLLGWQRARRTLSADMEHEGLIWSRCRSRKRGGPIRDTLWGWAQCCAGGEGRGTGQTWDRSLVKIPLAHQPLLLLVFSGLSYWEHTGRHISSVLGPLGGLC